MASLKSRLEHSVTRNALRAYLAEFISTFIFVFAAVGSAMSSSESSCLFLKIFYFCGCFLGSTNGGNLFFMLLFYLQKSCWERVHQNHLVWSEVRLQPLSPWLLQFMFQPVSLVDM